MLSGKLVYWPELVDRGQTNLSVVSDRFEFAASQKADAISPCAGVLPRPLAGGNLLKVLRSNPAGQSK